MWPNFSAKASTDFSSKTVRDNGSVAWANYDHVSFYHQPADVFIELFTINSSCSPHLTAIPEPTYLEDRKNREQWGRISDSEKSGDPNYPEALCTAIGLACENNMQCEPSVYSFCSDKEETNQGVIICIKQMKDDPEMAKQIFESFRWTD